MPRAFLPYDHGREPDARKTYALRATPKADTLEIHGKEFVWAHMLYDDI